MAWQGYTSDIISCVCARLSTCTAPHRARARRGGGEEQAWRRHLPLDNAPWGSMVDILAKKKGHVTLSISIVAVACGSPRHLPGAARSSSLTWRSGRRRPQRARSAALATSASRATAARAKTVLPAFYDFLLACLPPALSSTRYLAW